MINSGKDLIMSALASGVQSLANKPQKQKQTTTSTPLELERLYNLRDRIGVERDMLSEALRRRQQPKYSLFDALSNIQPQQSFTGAYGVQVSNPLVQGLSNALSAYGSAKKGVIDRAIENAKIDYETALKDLQFEADLSKAMGTKQTDEIEYTQPSVSDKLSEQQTKTAQTAYIKLDPDLPKNIRANKEAYGYMAREADLGSRTPEGGSTGAVERILSSVAKAKVGDTVLAERAKGLQGMTQYVGAVTDLARQNGAAASMMNSDKEGQRALGILNNPATYSAEELASAAEVVKDLYNRMLAVSGLPSVEQGYEAVSQQVQQNTGGIDWSKYYVKE